MKTRVLLQPGFDLGMFVRGIVIQDQMQIAIRHSLLLQGICFRARRTVDGQNGDRRRGVRGSGLALEVHEFRHGGLHAVGELVVADGTFQRIEFSETRDDSAIQLPHQRELVVLQLGARLGRRDVRHGIRARLENRTLIRRGQEAAVEIVQPARRDEPAIQHDEAGQVRIFAAESVASPSAHARAALQSAAGVQEIIRVRVLGKLARHRAHDREVVHALRDVREELAHRRAALPVLLKFPRRAERRAVVVELRRLHFHPERLAVLGGQPRLRVEGIHLRRPAVHVEKNDALRLRRKMRRSRHERIVQISADDFAEGFFREQRGERDGSETVRAAREHFAPRERAWDEVSTMVHGVGTLRRIPGK